jgi:hypothetical protein
MPGEWGKSHSVPDVSCSGCRFSPCRFRSVCLSSSWASRLWHGLRQRFAGSCSTRSRDIIGCDSLRHGWRRGTCLARLPGILAHFAAQQTGGLCTNGTAIPYGAALAASPCCSRFRRRKKAMKAFRIGGVPEGPVVGAVSGPDSGTGYRGGSSCPRAGVSSRKLAAWLHRAVFSMWAVETVGSSARQAAITVASA